jgi:hypothetical protein
VAAAPSTAAAAAAAAACAQRPASPAPAQLPQTVLHQANAAAQPRLLHLIFYLVASCVLPLTGLALSKRLGARAHLAVQALCVGAVVSRNRQLCAALLLRPWSAATVDDVDAVLRIAGAVVPVPLADAAAAARGRSPTRQCLEATGVLQVVLGFLLPTAVVVGLETAAAVEHAEGGGGPPPGLRWRCYRWLATNIYIAGPAAARVMLGLLAISPVWLAFRLAYMDEGAVEG